MLSNDFIEKINREFKSYGYHMPVEYSTPGFLGRSLMSGCSASVYPMFHTDNATETPSLMMRVRSCTSNHHKYNVDSSGFDSVKSLQLANDFHPNLMKFVFTDIEKSNPVDLPSHIDSIDFNLFEYVPGNHACIKSEALSSSYDKINCTIQLIDVLTFLFSRGLTHNDIKSENILYDANLQRLKLLDYGEVKRLLFKPIQDECYRDGCCSSDCYCLNSTADLDLFLLNQYLSSSLGFGFIHANNSRSNFTSENPFIYLNTLLEITIKAFPGEVLPKENQEHLTELYHKLKVYAEIYEKYKNSPDQSVRQFVIACKEKEAELASLSSSRPDVKHGSFWQKPKEPQESAEQSAMGLIKS
jgi:serine/threonine protein kinase